MSVQCNTLSQLVQYRFYSLCMATQLLKISGYIFHLIFRIQTQKRIHVNGKVDWILDGGKKFVAEHGLMEKLKIRFIIT